MLAPCYVNMLAPCYDTGAMLLRQYLTNGGNPRRTGSIASQVGHEGCGILPKCEPAGPLGTDWLPRIGSLRWLQPGKVGRLENQYRLARGYGLTRGGQR
jgi:hypothetical protein